MPAIRFICPHCEKPAEVQVTAVTRSRPCPHCGQAVVLQVASRGEGNGMIKRRALLVSPAATKSSTATLDPVVEPSTPKPRDIPAALPSQPLPVMNGPVYEPIGFVGDVLERLKFDPEVVETRRRLARGVTAVFICIVVAVVWDRVSPWSLKNAPQQVDVPASQKTQPPSPVKKENNVIGMMPGGTGRDANGLDLPAAIPFQGVENPSQTSSAEATPSARQPTPIRIVVP